MVKFLRDNAIVFVYMSFAVAIEIIAQFFVDAKPYISQFWLFLLVLLTLSSILFSIKKLKTKRILTFIFFAIQIAAVIASAYLYVSNGTAFQKEMIYQRNDAFGTLEQFNVDIFLIAICLTFLVALFIIIRKHKKRYANICETSIKKEIRIGALALSIVCAAVFVISPAISGIKEKKQTSYAYKLNYTQGDNNQMRGVTANILYELLKFGFSTGVNTLDIDEVEEFIYSEPLTTSKYHGISEGNNLVFILVESFDMHVLERYSPEENKLIFPNIMRLMEEGIFAANFRQKEKTDTSEVFSLLASYPTKKYVNYSFEKNSYPFSLPNLFKTKSAELGITPQVMSFHQNKASFYNRDALHPSLGFDKFYGIDEMKEYGMENLWNFPHRFSNRERSLDSKTVAAMKDVMFPTDRQFFSYWITFCMHGFYEERESLQEQGYYQKLDYYGLFPKGETWENHWRTYAASVMDFDRAVGIMLRDLEEKGLLSNTTIVLLSDHNTYYNSLTEYAKPHTQYGKELVNNLDPEGFRIPLIIYDQKLAKAFEDNGESKIITKFTTTADVLPTICDLFGIKAWKNLYLGSTIFNTDKTSKDYQESIVFSRIYNFFFNDKVAFYCLDDIRYKSEEFTEEDLELFINRANIHLEKLYYLDKIYFTDYFASHEYRAPQ